MPAASVPRKLPRTTFPELEAPEIRTPSPSFPEIRLPADRTKGTALTPPIVLPAVEVIVRPEPPLPRSIVPLGSVPMKLPTTRTPVAPPSSRTPEPTFPEIRFRSAAVAPPIVAPVAPPPTRTPAALPCSAPLSFRPRYEPTTRSPVAEGPLIWTPTPPPPTTASDRIVTSGPLIVITSVTADPSTASTGDPAKPWPVVPSTVTAFAIAGRSPSTGDRVIVPSSAPKTIRSSVP